MDSLELKRRDENELKFQPWILKQNIWQVQKNSIVSIFLQTDNSLFPPLE